MKCLQGAFAQTTQGNGPGECVCTVRDLFLFRGNKGITSKHFIGTL